MLTTDQKDAILRKAGIRVPGFPSRNLSERQKQADAEPIVKENLQADGRQNTAEQWARTIDALFVEYSAACAARDLRGAEQARRLNALREASGDPPT